MTKTKRQSRHKSPRIPVTEPRGPFWEMKRGFKRAMRVLYPEGGCNVQQHRDLVRVFAMSWGECIKATRDEAAFEEYGKYILEMTSPWWWPDSSWKWWRGRNRYEREQQY